MSELLTIEDLAEELRRSDKLVYQLDNDPFPSINAKETEHYYKDVKYSGLRDEYYGMPIEHPQKRDKYLLPKHIESVRFERGNPEENPYDHHYLIIKPTYELDTMALWVSYMRHGFQVNPKIEEVAKSGVSANLRIHYSDELRVPDVKINGDLIQIKMDEDLSKLLIPLNAYFEGVQKFLRYY